MDTQTLKTDAYLIASVVCGALSLVGIQFSIQSVASLIIAIGGALMIIVPAALATWREIHHLSLRSVQAASASLTLASAPTPEPPVTNAPASPSYAAPVAGNTPAVPSPATASDASAT